jgi:hypothetical protein
MSIKIAGLSSLINPPMVFLLIHRVDICAIMGPAENMWSKWDGTFYQSFDQFLGRIKEDERHGKQEGKMGYLGMKIVRQWEAARPKMVKALEEAGLLRKAEDWVNRRATDEMVWLMRRGTPWWSAAEIVPAKGFLPTEEGQETLTQDQMPFLPSE